MDDGRIDGDDIAYIAEPGVASRRGDEPCVLAGQPDGERPMDVDHADDVAVHFADENHPGDLEGLRVGHAKAVAKLGHLAETRHERSDLRASPVDDDREDPDRSQQDDVLGKSLECLGLPVARLFAIPRRGHREKAYR